MIHQAAPLAVHGGTHPAAAVMPDHEDMLHPQHIDGELQDREVVGVLGRGEIGDIAVDEELARIEVHDLIGGHPAVGAADPEIFRRLLALEPAEEAGLGGNPAFGPGAVVGYQVIEHGCRPI